MKVRMRRPTHALQRVPFSRGPRWSCPWLARHLGGRRRPSSRSTLTLPTLGSTMSVIKSASNGRRKEAGRGYLSQGNTSKASRGHVDAPFFFFLAKQDSLAEIESLPKLKSFTDQNLVTSKIWRPYRRLNTNPSRNNRISTVHDYNVGALLLYLTKLAPAFLSVSLGKITPPCTFSAFFPLPTHEGFFSQL